MAFQRLQSAPRTIGITLPAPVLLVVERALATDPAQRWPSAAALADAARFRNVPSVSPPSRTNHRMVYAAAALVAVLVVAFGAWLLTRGVPKAAAVGAPAASPAGRAGPVGFVPCGKQYCPAEPMCWAGLTEISGKAFAPRPVDCTRDHYWETFAAIEFPAGAEQVPPDDLMKQADIAAACSPDVLAAHSGSPIKTKSWRREAWPIDQPGSGGTLLHCLAGSPDGETRTAMFR